MYITIRGCLYPYSFARMIARCVIILLGIISSLCLSSCHDDDNSLSNREENEAIYEIMKEYYLWYNEIPPIEELDLEANPEEFFYSLLSDKDGSPQKGYYSYITIDNNDFLGTPYMGFGMLYLPETLQISFVEQNSPAAKAGIHRGDFIRAIEGIRTTSANIVEILASQVNETMFTIGRWNEEKGREEELDILVPGREMLNPSVILLDTIYTGTHVGKVGYLAYKEFLSGLVDQPELYLDELKQLFVQFNSAGVKHLILDLRDNLGGDINVCHQLCTMIAPREAMGKVFFIGKRNDKNENFTYLFDSESVGEETLLDVEKLVVIVDINSASASEVVIHCLKPYLGDHLQVVGTKTYGKNVGMDIQKVPGTPWAIVPITFYCLNCNGEYEYSDGLEPDVYIEDDLSGKVYPLGDRQEPLLKKAMQVMGAE